jgi:hypothetical protein
MTIGGYDIGRGVDPCELSSWGARTLAGFVAALVRVWYEGLCYTFILVIDAMYRREMAVAVPS